MNPQSSLANSAIFKSSIPDPFPFSIELSEINWLQIGWRICLPNHPMVTEVLVTRMTTRRNLATELHILYHWMSLNKPVINLISSGSRLLSDCPLPWKRFNRESFIYQTCRTCGHRDKQIPSKLTACHIFAPSCISLCHWNVHAHSRTPMWENRHGQLFTLEFDIMLLREDQGEFTVYLSPLKDSVRMFGALFHLLL